MSRASTFCFKYLLCGDCRVTNYSTPLFVGIDLLQAGLRARSHAPSSKQHGRPSNPVLNGTDLYDFLHDPFATPSRTF